MSKVVLVRQISGNYPSFGLVDRLCSRCRSKMIMAKRGQLESFVLCMRMLQLPSPKFLADFLVASVVFLTAENVNAEKHERKSSLFLFHSLASRGHIYGLLDSIYFIIIIISIQYLFVGVENAVSKFEEGKQADHLR